MSQEYSQEQIINYFAQQITETRMHVDSLSRIERYREWQNLKEKLPQDDIATHGFRVYSQNDQDGILEYIFKILDIKKGLAIEFGCDNGIENNTHYLLTKGWTCVWVDVVEEHLQFIKDNFKGYIDDQKLVVLNRFINKDNINDIFKIYDNIIDCMVIDTDWNEYYLFEALELKPKVICIEYNAHIPHPTKLTVPYNSEQELRWDGSNCFGSSFSALYELGKEKGYQCIGCSLAGTDMFFVRKDLLIYFDSYFQRYCQYPEILYKPPRYALEFTLGHKSSPGNWISL